MDREGFERAARYWTDRDEAETPDKHMESSELRAAVGRFLADHKVCALATCASGVPRCTPLEYDFHHDALWIFSEGGVKFRGLEPAVGASSAPVSAAVFEPTAKFTQLKSAQVTGRATIVDPSSPEFYQAVAEKGVPTGGTEAFAAKVAKLAKMLNLVKVAPVEVDYLDSSLKKAGYDVRQHLVW